MNENKKEREQGDKLFKHLIMNNECNMSKIIFPWLLDFFL